MAKTKYLAFICTDPSPVRIGDYLVERTDQVKYLGSVFPDPVTSITTSRHALLPRGPSGVSWQASLGIPKCQLGWRDRCITLLLGLSSYMVMRRGQFLSDTSKTQAARHGDEYAMVDVQRHAKGSCEKPPHSLRPTCPWHCWQTAGESPAVVQPRFTATAFLRLNKCLAMLLPPGSGRRDRLKKWRRKG